MSLLLPEGMQTIFLFTFSITHSQNQTGPVRDTFAAATPLVFNMKTQAWQDTFEESTSTSTSASASVPASTSTHTSTSTSTSKGPIIGGVVGGLFVLGLIAGAFVCRRRRNSRKKNNAVVEGAKLPGGGERSFDIGQNHGQTASGIHPNPYPRPPGSQNKLEMTSGVPLRGPQVYPSNQNGSYMWPKQPERSPQEGYHM